MGCTSGIPLGNARYDIPGWKVLGATPGLGHLEGSCFDDKVGSGFLSYGWMSFIRRCMENTEKCLKVK